RRLARRRPRPERGRALSRGEVDQLLTRTDIGLRERTLWRMLYETAARSAEVLALDVEDLDLPNRRAKVRRKGGTIDVIIWQTGTARLLPRLLKGRKSGPVFVTARKARVQLPAADLGDHPPARRCSRGRLGRVRAVHAHRPAARCAVRQGLRRRAPAPAPAFRTHSRLRARHRDADAEGAIRSHIRPVTCKVRASVGRGARPAPGR